jgi:hypothetical protein
MVRAALLALTLVALLTPPALATPEPYVPESLARYFRLEWGTRHGARGTLVEGYVYNQSRRVAERMVIEIERLDAAGAVVGRSSTWVAGLVPMNSRAYFSARVPEADTYRVRVISFDWSCAGSGGGGGM